MTLRQCRGFIADEAVSDAELEGLRDALYAFAEVAIDICSKRVCPPDAISCDEREDFEERAAILEHEAGMPRKQAERRARLQIARRVGHK